MGESNARLAANPRCANNGLPDIVVDNFAALRRLVLRTPLADLLETKPGKLPSASNTFRHVYLEDYQQSTRPWEDSGVRRPGRIRPGSSVRRRSLDFAGRTKASVPTRAFPSSGCAWSCGTCIPSANIGRAYQEGRNTLAHCTSP